jgi:hypothetical protein
MRKQLVLSLAAGLVAVGLLSVAWAQEKAAPASGHESPPLMPEKPAAAPQPRLQSDPAFNKFVDVRLLAPAIEARNAGLLTDLALQFALAESVLERSHKTFSSQEVATLAVAAATATHDTASLDRLAKLAAKLKDSPLATKIAVAKLEAGKTRSTAPTVMIAIDSFGLGDVAGFQGFQNAIQTLKILGDRPQIESRLKTLQKQDGLPPALREQGILIAKEALAALPTDSRPSKGALALELLLSSHSRSDDDQDEHRPPDSPPSYDDEGVQVNEWGNRLDGTQAQYGEAAKARRSAENWGYRRRISNSWQRDDSYTDPYASMRPQ